MTERGAHCAAARVEHATAATVRAVAGRAGVSVSFGERARVDDDSQAHVRLPATATEPSPGDMARLRGEADRAALRLRHHDPVLHRRNRPADEAAGAVFDALESARFEALGARNLPGVAANLAVRLDARCLAEGFGEAVDPDGVPESTAFALLLRREATGTRWPEAADRVMQAWLQRIGPQVRDAVGRLAGSIEDQGVYAAGTHRLLEAAGFACDGPGTATSPSLPKSDRPDDAEGANADAPAKEHEQRDSSERREDGAETAGAKARAAVDSPVAIESPQSTEAPAPVEAGDAGEAADAVPPPAYRAFTTEHDVTATPEDFCDPRQLLQWRKRLDDETAPYRAGVIRLTARLQQRLLARQAEGWDFELDEGLLDAERLASVIADPNAGTVYKALRESDFPDTVLSILIDSSGSMRGLPIRLAAMCADIVALALERCAIKVEILGYTTRDWRGGRSREQWVRSGRPPHPGRLNDLCHVVYKAASTPWRRARNGLGILLDEALLKENVDGEALLWAWHRLLMRAERRRILLVLSDGAPADDSTSSANPPGYLEQHLRQVIARIERERSVELAAIGLGHDVRRYYRNAVKLDDPRDLGETIVRSLDALLR